MAIKYLLIQTVFHTIRKHSIPDSQQKKYFPILIIHVGHECLTTHLHPLKIFTTLDSILCNTEINMMDVNHTKMRQLYI